MVKKFKYVLSSCEFLNLETVLELSNIIQIFQILIIIHEIFISLLVSVLTFAQQYQYHG